MELSRIAVLMKGGKDTPKEYFEKPAKDFTKGKKYIRRIPKQGGGYTYTYAPRGGPATRPGMPESREEHEKYKKEFIATGKDPKKLFTGRREESGTGGMARRREAGRQEERQESKRKEVAVLRETTDFEQLTNDEKLKYATKLRVFWAWFNSESDNLTTDDWKTPDLAWEHTLSATITSVLQVQLYLELQYDKEIDKAMRFKETLALGISYKLF